MANGDIREFYFYEQYLWRPLDFANMQTWLTDSYRALAEGAFGGARLQGLDYSLAGNLDVDIAAGIASAPNGRQMIFAGGTETFVADGSNPRWSLLVLRPLDTDTNLINQPTNPVVQVPLHKQLQCELVLISGTPGVSPAYPSTQANDVIVCAVKLAAAQTSLAISDIDREPLSLPRKRRSPIRLVAGGGEKNVISTDRIVEVDCSASGTVMVLPLAALVPGEEFNFVKIDSSVNSLGVSGQGGEQISGQPLQEIDDQWGYLRCYSNGVGWRMF